ncbi:hypothetical protein TNCV_2603211 [Trichonephila clavipes]|nr:hypothetical protein TNCV_2603211 [Trichonephila clavipes]
MGRHSSTSHDNNRPTASSVLSHLQVNGLYGGKAVSLANRNGKIYRQNFEADVFPSGAVDLKKGWRVNSRGFLPSYVCQKKPPVGKRTRPEVTPPSLLSSHFR